MQTKRHKLIGGVVVIALVATLAFPITFLGERFTTVEISRVHAQQSGVGGVLETGTAGVAACAGLAGLMKGISSLLGSFGVEVPTNYVQGGFKEQFLDCVVRQVANVIIRQITNSIVVWIQSGFDGNPAFVTNLDQLYKGIADRVVGEFVGSDLEFLCSPFRAQIQLALINNYRQPEQFVCSLSDVIDNVDDFVNGDFAQGGWAGWFQLTQIPKNNPYGAYIEASNELTSRLSVSIGNQEKELEFGSGFLSWKTQDCFAITTDPTTGATSSTPLDPDFVGPPPPGTEFVCDEPKTATPGSVIESSLKEVLPSGFEELQLADEVNEIINALVAYLISDVITGEKGLAGYNSADFTHEFPDIDIPDIPGSGPTTPNDSEPPGPPGPSTCFVANGTFLEPTQGNEWGRVNLPLPANVSYDRIEVDLDVTHGGWHPTIDSARYAAFWLARGGNRDLFGYVPVEAPSSNAIILRHGIGQVHGSKVKKATRGNLQEGATYHFSYVYDVSTNTIDLVVTESGTGERVGRLTSAPDVPGINVGDERFLMDFSFQAANPNPVEVPSYGWEYRNLRVSFLTNGDEPSSCRRANVLGLSDGEVPGDIGNESGPPGGPGGRPDIEP